MHPYIHAQNHPDKPAYIMAAAGETVTYRQLDEQSNRIAQLFRSLGLKPGDHIALFLENNARFFEICWGAQRSGLIYTAISSRLTAAEVEYIVNDCGARLFITSKYLAEPAAELAPPAEGRRQPLHDRRRRCAGYELVGRDGRALSRDADRRPDGGPRHALFVGHHRAAQGRAAGGRAGSRSMPTIRCSPSRASSTAWTRTPSISRRRRSITPRRCAST